MTGDARQPVSAIDWAAARERLDRVAQLVAGGGRTPEQARSVLEARARALAAPIAVEAPGDALEVLVFGISGDRYAIESRFVFSVLRLEHISLVPGAEAAVVGLTAWRGELLTLLDLRILTGTSSAALSDLGWVVVLGDESVAFGVLADRVEAVARLPLSEIRPLPAGPAGDREYLRGVTSDRMLVVDATHLTRTSR